MIAIAVITLLATSGNQSYLFLLNKVVFATLPPTDLRLEYLRGPEVSFDVQSPRFFWSFQQDGGRSHKQTAYQVQKFKT